MDSVKSKIKKSIYNLFPKHFKNFLAQEILNNHDYFKYLNISFSQEGEDQILSHLFYGIENGFFIDVGAHHPIKYSNTYKFYLKGWRGINIDAMPGSMVEFQKIRPGDINLELGVSAKNETLDYAIFNSTGINTFSKDFVQKMIDKGSILTNTIHVNTQRLETILATYLPEKQEIDFLTIDVENFEMEVLQSNDWNRFRPKVILVESLELKTKKQLETFFRTVDYDFIAQTVNNIYFTTKKHP